MQRVNNETVKIPVMEHNENGWGQNIPLQYMRCLMTKLVSFSG